MKKNILIAILSLVAFVATAQSKTSLGLSIGSRFGISFQHYVSATSSLQYDLGYEIQERGLMFTALYHKYFNLVGNLDLYVGGGFNLGYQNPKYHDTKFVFGLDPTVGFQYAFPGSPVALGLGYQPQINLTVPSKWNNIILGVRFSF